MSDALSFLVVYLEWFGRLVNRGNQVAWCGDFGRYGVDGLYLPSDNCAR